MINHTWGFTVKNWKNLLPQEDRYYCGHNILAVADGVTRDPRNMHVLPFGTDTVAQASNWRDYPNPFKMIGFFWKYPRINPWVYDAADVPREYFGMSPAAVASKVFLECAAAQLQNPNRKKDLPSLVGSVGFGNSNLLGVNTNLNPRHGDDSDYLENDLWGCVGAVAALIYEHGKPVLSYVYVSDSGLCIFGADGEIKLKTRNMMPEDAIRREIKERHHTDFSMPKGRVIKRRDYCNNPSNPLVYGVFNGQPEAMQLLQKGEITLEKGDIVALYTDGLEHVISDEFGEVLRAEHFTDVQRICQKRVKTEGTLVYTHIK